jgi:hypothetical protein
METKKRRGAWRFPSRDELDSPARARRLGLSHTDFRPVSLSQYRRREVRSTLCIVLRVHRLGFRCPVTTLADGSELAGRTRWVVVVRSTRAISLAVGHCWNRTNRRIIRARCSGQCISPYTSRRPPSGVSCRPERVKYLGTAPRRRAGHPAMKLRKGFSVQDERALPEQSGLVACPGLSVPFALVPL